MSQHGAGSGAGRRRASSLPQWILLLATIAPGCETLPCRFTGEQPVESEVPRHVGLVRRLAADCAVELGHHPVRTVTANLTETADALAAAGRGVAGKRILLPLRGPPGPIDSVRPTLDPVALEAELKRRTGSDLRPAHITFAHDGRGALAPLLAVIDGASCRLDVMMFIWECDDVGRAVARHLAARAAAGVAVRVLVDGGGTVFYSDGGGPGPVKETVAWLARQPNVSLLRTHDGWARFDHRKLVVADEQTAWTGGRNFRAEAFTRQHDMTLVLTGPLVADLEHQFDCFWEEQGGKAVAARRRAEPPEDCGPECNLARLVGTGPLRHDLADALFLAIDHARDHIYLENPYLCDSRLLLRLAKARRRGVDVRVVLTIDTTPAIVNHANRVTANYLLRAGVRVYLYAGSTHAKALSVDGLWAYTGTGNFDALSLRHDYELGLAIGAGPAIRQLEEELLVPDFRPDWELKEPLPVTARDCASEVLACIFG